MKSLSGNMFFNIMYTISNLLFLFVSSLYVSRILLADGVGQVAYAQNIASYFVTFAALGIPSYGVKAISKERKEQGNVNKVFSELFTINAVSTILFSTIYLVLICLVPSFEKDYQLFLCYGLQIIMNCFNIDWLYQGHEKYGYIAVRSLIIKIILLICIFVFVKERNDYIIYALLSSIASCGNYLLNIFNARKFVRFTFKDLSFKRHLTPILILAISLFLSSVYSKVDITMLGIMCSDTVIGLYSNAHKTVDIVITMCTAVSAVFLPRLSCFEKDKQEFYRLINTGISILCFIAIPATIGLAILSPYLVILIFGQSFAMSAHTVQIFSVLIIIKSFGNLLCYQLVIATGNERKRLPAYLVAAIANIILNLFLIPYFEQNGAAIASVISELIVNVWQFISIQKVVKISIPKKPFVDSFFGSLLMAIAVVMILKLLQEFFFLKIAIAIIVGIIIYFIVNILIKNEITMSITMRLLKNRKKK